MKRKLEFRAWDEKRKTMFIVRTGFLPKGVTRKRDFFIGFNNTGLEVSEYEGKGAWRIFPVMQSTGMLDRNGKEIFEGDILRYPDAYDCSSENGYDWEEALSVGEIEWDSNQAQFTVSNRQSVDLECFFEDISEVEVIGNIYENPELLQSI